MGQPCPSCTSASENDLLILGLDVHSDSYFNSPGLTTLDSKTVVYGGVHL